MENLEFQKKPKISIIGLSAVILINYGFTNKSFYELAFDEQSLCPDTIIYKYIRSINIHWSILKIFTVIGNNILF